MTIEEVKDRRDKLRDLLWVEIVKFQDETGVGIHKIDLVMTDTTLCGDKSRKFKLSFLDIGLRWE